MQYEIITFSDYDDICSFYEAYLNSGDYVKEEIKQTMESADFYGVKAVEDGRLIGVCYGTAGVLMTYPHPELEAEIIALSGGRRIFCVDAMMVRRGYRSHHISTELLQKLAEHLRANGYQAAFSEMWVYPDGSIPVAPLFINLGNAVYEKKVDGFYSELKKYGLKCPLCGTECTCSAMLRLTEL